MAETENKLFLQLFLIVSKHVTSQSTRTQQSCAGVWGVTNDRFGTFTKFGFEREADGRVNSFLDRNELETEVGFVPWTDLDE